MLVGRLRYERNSKRMTGKKPIPEHKVEPQQGRFSSVITKVLESIPDSLAALALKAVEKILDQKLLFTIVICTLISILAIVAMPLLGAGRGMIVVFSATVLCLICLYVFAVWLYLRHESQERKEREEARKQKLERLNPATSHRDSRHEAYEAVIESPNALRFWEPFVEGKLQVVTGRFTRDSRDLEVWEPAGLVGAGDALAIADLRSFFAVMRLSDFQVSYAGIDTKDTVDSNSHLILIGGPDYNLITKRVMNELRSKATFEFDSPKEQGHRITIKDTEVGGKHWSYKEPEVGRLIDYSLIIRTANPLWPTKRLLLVAGCSSHGTWAGIRFVTSLSFLEHDLVSGGKDCEFLIETELWSEDPSESKVLYRRELKEKAPA